MVNLGSAYGEIQIGTEGAQSSIQGLASSMRSVGMKMSAAITAPLAGLAAVGLKSAGDFEQSLNQVQVVAGATAAQMAALEEQALDLGAATSFSAGEAAAGMLELAKSGLTAEEVMASIGGVLNLAAAGNLEVAQAAEIASNAMNAFGMAAEDMPQVADLLAAAANASSVEVSDLALSMQMAGAVFAANGQPIEDMIALLAVLGNNGLKGSDAGTALKTMMMRLTAPTDKAREVLHQYGIEIYNADGSMRDMFDIMGQFYDAMGVGATVTTAVGGATADMTKAANKAQSAIPQLTQKIQSQQQELNILNQELGQTIARYGEGSTQAQRKQMRIDKMTASLAENERKLVSQTQAVDKFNAAQATASTVTKQVTDEMRNETAAILFGTDAIRPFNIFMRETPEGLAAMGIEVGRTGAASEVAEARMKGLTGAVEYLKGSIESALIGSILPYLDSLSGMIRYGADLITMLMELPAPIKNAALAFSLVMAAMGPLLIGLPLLVGFFGALLSPIGLVVVAIAGLAAAWAADFGGIRQAVAGWWTAMMPYFQNVVTWLQVTGPGALRALKAVWDDVWGTLSGAVVTSITMIQENWGQIAGVFEPTLVAIQEAFSAVAGDIDKMRDALSELGAEVNPTMVALLGVLAVLLPVLTRVIGRFVWIKNLIIATIGNLGDFITLIAQRITRTFQGVQAVLYHFVMFAYHLLSGEFLTALKDVILMIGATFVMFGQMLAGWISTLLLVLQTVTEAVGLTFDDVIAFLDALELPNPLQPLVDFIDKVEVAIDGLMLKWEGFVNWLDGMKPWAGGATPGNAIGASSFRGGMTLVGERGPELVSLPRSARIYTAGQTNRMAGAGDGGGGQSITVNVERVESGFDLEALAWKVAGEIQRRQ